MMQTLKYLSRILALSFTSMLAILANLDLVTVISVAFIQAMLLGIANAIDYVRIQKKVMDLWMLARRYQNAVEISRLSNTPTAEARFRERDKELRDMLEEFSLER